MVHRKAITGKIVKRRRSRKQQILDEAKGKRQSQRLSGTGRTGGVGCWEDSSDGKKTTFWIGDDGFRIDKYGHTYMIHREQKTSEQSELVELKES